MDIKLPVSAHTIANQTFYEVFQGAEVYATARGGDTVNLVCTDGTVKGTVQTVDIGPLGKFLAPSYPHTSHINRTHDVRAIADALDDRYPAKTKGNEKALDPRTLYTSLTILAGTPEPEVLAA